MKLLQPRMILSLISMFIMAAIFCPFVAMADSYNSNSSNPVIVIDKKIRAVGETVFYDNIPSSQKTFVEGDQIEFSIKVENRGTINLTNINVVDYLPKYLTLMIFPGVDNLTDNTVKTTIDNLNPGDSKEYIIRARISDLPSSNYANSLIQLNNRACASNSQTGDCDNAKYFVGMSTTPVTGTNDIMIETVFGLVLIAGSVGFRKLARGY